MAFAQYLFAVPVEKTLLSSNPNLKNYSILVSSLPLSSPSSSATSTTSGSGSGSFFSASSSSIKCKVPKLPRIGHKGLADYLEVKHLDVTDILPLTWSNRVKVNANPKDSEAISAADAFTEFKHLLLPITDRNPYLSEGTRQAAATTAALAKKYGADITVVVIDEKLKDSIPEHDTQLSSIRWHLSEGGFQEFKLLERLGEGSKPTAIIGEVADEMNLDLVVMSMEAIHSKHVDANLLAEFVPCPVMLLPL